jgi:hypothetical protein
VGEAAHGSGRVRFRRPDGWPLTRRKAEWSRIPWRGALAVSARRRETPQLPPTVSRCAFDRATLRACPTDWQALVLRALRTREPRLTHVQSTCLCDGRQGSPGSPWLLEGDCIRIEQATFYWSEIMNRIIWLVGLVVIVLFVAGFFGLR